MSRAAHHEREGSVSALAAFVALVASLIVVGAGGCRLDDTLPAGVERDAWSTDPRWDPASTRWCIAVAAAEFGSDGSVGIIDAATGAAWLDQTRTHHDALVRVVDGEVYVVHREGADLIQKLDRENGLRTVWELRLGPGANPWDLASLGDGRAIAPLYGTGHIQELLVEGPDAPKVRRSIPVDAPPEEDGRVEVGGVLVVDDVVLVVVQGLDRYPRCLPSSRGSLVALDRETLTPVPFFDGESVLRLQGCNPTQLLLLDEDTLLVGISGNFRSLVGEALHVDDGGIERIDLRTGRSLGWVTTETGLGDRDIVRLAGGAEGRLWVSLADDAFAISVHPLRLDAGGSARLGPEVFASEGAYALLEAEGHLFIADRARRGHGVVVLDARSGAAVDRIGTFHPPFDLAAYRIDGASCGGRTADVD